jgi:hypothetical protein
MQVRNSNIGQYCIISKTIKVVSFKSVKLPELESLDPQS